MRVVLRLLTGKLVKCCSVVRAKVNSGLGSERTPVGVVPSSLRLHILRSLWRDLPAVTIDRYRWWVVQSSNCTTRPDQIGSVRIGLWRCAGFKFVNRYSPTRYDWCRAGRYPARTKGEYTSSDPEGPCVEVEYTHSVPALANSGGSRSGRVVKVYGVHKVYRLR